MHVMSAGHGYRYLLKSVAIADGARALSTPLVDYYTAQGTPPGRWLGSGVAGLSDGWISQEDEVTEEQLRLLMGEGRNPVTGSPLGRAFPVYRSQEERIQAQVEHLGASMSKEDRAGAVQRIKTEEVARKSKRAVAGFDFTFSAPKSVSVLWALADSATRAWIIAAHHAAVADVVDLMEREVAATRMGATGPDGAIAQVAVDGLIATAFDHYDSRSGDPQLHTHVVIANKARTTVDGTWRSLDGRPLHAAVVAMSEHYNAVLADRLTRDLGVVWQSRRRGADRNSQWEIASVPQGLIDTFSSRSSSIDRAKEQLIADYVATHGHQPSPTTIIKLRQQATLATRPFKTVHSLADLTQRWHHRATDVLADRHQEQSTAGLLESRAQKLLGADSLSDAQVGAIGAAVVQEVSDRRSTWRRWNLHAEATRQTMGLRFATAADREAVLGQIIHAAERASLRLTPPALAVTPTEFRRADGTSVFTPRHSAVFSSSELLAAEARLVKHADTTTGPTVTAHVLDAMTVRTDHQGRRLDGGQVAALAAITRSGRVLDVLVGPAGTGKTTAMRALRNVWEAEHRNGSVVGLAPSAAAAQVLADDLGIATENTAKWLHDQTHAGQQFAPGQLVIVDEASLAGTRSLDRIVGHAADVGAKVLLVGDWAQLGAVEAGGAFGMLVRRSTDVPELHDVHRFHQDWERDASLELRKGDPAVIDTYAAHDRICEGDTETMLDEVYRAWTADLDVGRSSVMIVQTSDAVAALNVRARADRIASGQVVGHGAVELHDDTEASVGDLVLSRRNNRTLRAGKGWVKNGDRWRITATDPDGSVTVEPADHPGGTVCLPADYVNAHVELGYAITVHRAQGATVDTAHTAVTTAMTRETLYVAMSRGRQANTAYVITDQPDGEAHVRSGDDQPTARDLLQGVLKNVGSELSVHDALRAQHDRAASIAQLAAEYEAIAAVAQHQRWAYLIRRSGLDAEQAEAVVASEAFGPLAAQLRLAEAAHHNPDQLLPRLVAGRPLDDVSDPAAVLHHRLVRATNRRSGTDLPRQTSRMIVGLIAQATGPMEPDMRQALEQRMTLIEQRADALLDTVIGRSDPWLQSIGRPRRPGDLTRWRGQLRTVVAYRDRYGITDPSSVLGPKPGSEVQRRDAFRARIAMRQATSFVLARPTHDHALEVGRRRPDRPSRSI